ncbi:hypothetical protein B4915_06850 [Leucobacter massiliensis]|uniref:Peptidoglycan binding-like domain-containing protein n=2 Tax=Leucobacter massiliensis TaxID=1686285 RepID=A0A2S9QPP7_9MICO|nr:hypothetical protein B4915_06850 [Leucobacter massiliensis]
MQFIVSPAEIAARTAAPDPGPVTAPVELREIENTVVARGEITYADAVAVSIDAAGGEERPVITGHIPEVGAIFQPGSIALELAGRPVVVLPGELPAYRTLSVGMRGPDVLQLKAALVAMGFGVGDPSSDAFDYDTAVAVGALYEQIGYPAADGGDESRLALRDAERGVRDANTALAQAQAALAEARDAGAPNPIGEQAAVNAAAEALSDAQEALGIAQEGVLPRLPSSEALFLGDLPRRVDEVSVRRGDILSRSPMSVSGASLTITGTFSRQDAELLSEGDVAFYPGPDGEELTATVQSIRAPGAGGSSGSGSGSGDGGEGEDTGAEGGSASGSGGGGDRYTVTFSPGELTPEQIDALRGTNVRVRVPIAATDGEVLAVPIAALSAGSGGEDRVELLIDARGGADAETELIPVEAGLAADGFVEIVSDDPRIEAGAKVVVGR